MSDPPANLEDDNAWRRQVHSPSRVLGTRRQWFDRRSTTGGTSSSQSWISDFDVTHQQQLTIGLHGSAPVVTESSEEEPSLDVISILG